MEIVEILSALRHCTSALGCDTCPMRAGIEQRAFCVATLLKESKTAITDLLAGIDASKRRCAQAQAERDALQEKQRWIPVTERTPNTIPCNAGTELTLFARLIFGRHGARKSPTGCRCRKRRRRENNAN